MRALRVLQVRTRAPLGREHAVPVEHIVFDAVVREIRVLHCADADLRRQRGTRARVAVRAAPLKLGGSALDGLVDQIREPHRIAGARLEHLLVGAEHGAERDVLRARGSLQPAGLRADGEHHGEMLRLRRADDVEQPRTAERLRAVTQRREIRGAVAVAAVLLAHDERQRLAVAIREPRRKGAQRAVVDAREPFLLELGGDFG